MNSEAFYRALFQFHFDQNLKILDTIKKHFQVLEHTGHALFCHSINAHQVWNARILNQPTEEVFKIHALDTCQDRMEKNQDETELILEKFDLNESIVYLNSRYERFDNSINDILYHILNHYAHHRGQIVMDMRNNGIEPPITDFIFYKREL
jgi:uncharacterized damage-inducible protein DinB